MHLYGLANAVQNAVSPTPPNQLTDWEKKALRGLRAQGYRIGSDRYDSRLLELTNNVATKFQLKEMPKIVIYKQDYPNAAMLTFSNTMFISTSLMEILNKDEIEAVIGHELGHRRQQSKLLAAGAIATGVTVVLGSFFSGKIRNGVEWLFDKARDNIPFLQREEKILGISPKKFTEKTKKFFTRVPLVIAMLYGAVAGFISKQLAYPMASFKRGMELDADKQSSDVLHKPEALISALKKLQTRSQELHNRVIPATDPGMANVPIPPNPETPKTAEEKEKEKKLASHPDFATRERKLREMAEQQQGRLSHA